jgi:hypothetical protein
MSPAYSVRRPAAFVFYNIAATLVLLLVLEGIASVVDTFRDAYPSKPTSEPLQTEYDRDLGWVNLPNVYLANAYGLGKYLRTNSQRFRNNADFTTRVPPGKTRIICSGDSFTLGYGVDNDHTWAQVLASRSKNVETVNMGQGGYGADQAYLWYKRDGEKLDHDIQIFAVITDDFRRMQNQVYLGYGKPVLAVENDRLVTRNVPVPRKGWSPPLARLQNALNNMHIARLLRSALRRDTAATVTQAPKERNSGTPRIVSYMLDDLAERNRAKNSVLVLAYLPTRVENGADWMSWRKFLDEYARQRGLLYLDLTEDFYRLPPEELDKLFIRGIGHYTEAGNAFVADLIYQRLLANPETAAKFHLGSTSDGAHLQPATTVPR